MKMHPSKRHRLDLLERILLTLIALIAIALVALLICSEAAAATRRVPVGTIAESWCVELIVRSKPQAAKPVSRRGGADRASIDPEVWLEGWVDGAVSQYILGV